MTMNEKQRHVMMDVGEESDVVVMIVQPVRSEAMGTVERLRPRRCAAEAQSD